MTRLAYLALSTALFLVAVTVHIMSYRIDVSAGILKMETALAVLLCLPLVLLFVQVKKQVNAAGLLPRFWDVALEKCPRWIWGSMNIACLLMWATGIATTFFHLPSVAFHTAGLLIPASAALSYSVTLWRARS